MGNTKHLTTDKFNKDEILCFPVIKSPYARRVPEPEPVKAEVNLQPSMTIQGEAYTIQELLKKHSSGSMPDVGREPIYTDPIDIDTLDLSSFDRMDLAEQQEYQKYQKKQIKALQISVKKQAEQIKETEKSLLSREKQTEKTQPKND